MYVNKKYLNQLDNIPFASRVQFQSLIENLTPDSSTRICNIINQWPCD